MADAAIDGRIPEREVFLPGCEKLAKISGRPLKGRDMIQAQRYAAKDGDTAGGFALLATVVTIDGMPQVYEDFLDMDTRDITAISNAVKGDPRFPTPADAAAATTQPPASRGSSPSGSA